MSRDLYGELLANVLNRGAPQGHFAAYIQPNEAAMLRSQGGGVAPGGGQYMANGLPSFQPIGSDQPGIAPGTAADAAASGWGPGGGSGGVDAAAVADMLQGIQREEAARLGMAVAPAVQAATPLPGTFSYSGPEDFGPPAIAAPPAVSLAQYDPAAETTSTAVPLEMQAMNQVALDQIALHEKAKADAKALEKSKDYTTRQELNLKAMLTDPFWDTKTDEERQSLLDRPISKYGIGKFAPGGIVAGQGAPADVIAHVMQRSKTTNGYAINEPGENVSVPPGYHMGLIPALMGSLISASAPGVFGLGVNAARALTGAKGVMSMVPGLKGLDAEISGLRDKAISGVGNFFDPVTSAVSDMGTSLGAGLGAALDNFQGVLPDFGPPMPEVETPGRSAPDPGPDIAPINEFASPPNIPGNSVSITDGVARNPGEQERGYYVPSEEVQRRIAENIRLGRQRSGIV